MARIEWIEHRLLNWARWKLGEGMGLLGYANVKYEPVVDCSGGYEDAPIPVNAIEAGETDAAVCRLNPPGLAKTVWEVYCGPGGLKDKARRLCCGEATIHARISQAHRHLAREFGERRRAAEAERDRVETLQLTVRP